MEAEPLVLHVILTGELAGSEKHLVELCRGLRGQRWRTAVATTDAANPRLIEAYSEWADVVTLPALPAPLLGPRLAEVSRRLRPRVVHAHMGTATAAAAGAAVISHLPLVSTLHFVAPRHEQARAPGLSSWLYRRMMSRATAVICVSEAVREAALTRGWGHPDRLHVVNNGIGGDRRPAAPAPLPAVSRVLGIGRLEPEKGMDVLIRSMAAVDAAELVIAGDGSERPRLEALARTLLPGRCTFLGFVDDVPTLLERATMLVVPNRAEGFGLVAVEAMRAGRPVVGFAAGGILDIVVPGETGSLADDEAGLSLSIATLAGDRDLSARLGLAGQVRYLERFTADAMARNTVAVYEAACRAH